MFDRDRITGAGVTSGIDFALRVIAELWGPDHAQIAQLTMEYDPAPPFPAAGSPETSDPALVTRVRNAIAPMHERRRAATLAARAGLVP